MDASQDWVERIAAEVQERGYAILENLVDAEQMTRLDAETAEIRRREAPARKTSDETGAPGSASHRIRNLVSRSAVFRDAVAFGPINAIAERLLGPGYLIFASAVNDVGPGERPQRLHTDDILINLPRPLPRPLVLNAIWALTDFTIENGATRLFPGSHRRTETSAPTGDGTIATMTRGSILLYHGSLWHGAGGNTTTATRRIGLIFTYCARFIRPYENQLKLIPLEQARAFPPKLRQLIGLDYVIDADLRD
jgi:ectoine hydroxylase-related dioxygenase (phytanoyl-CoA dioxygenase family)